MTPERTAAVVLAAGASTRFGGDKLLARLDGRPLLQHVLDAISDVGLAEVIVVLRADAEPQVRALAWRRERRVVNRAPEGGLSSSLRTGIVALADRPSIDAALIVLGDQPRLAADTVRAILSAATPDGPPVVAPRYALGGGPNPVLVQRSAWHLVGRSRGDEGLRTVIAERPHLVTWIDVPGRNPDVDTPEDLAALGEAVSRGGA